MKYGDLITAERLPKAVETCEKLVQYNGSCLEVNCIYCPGFRANNSIAKGCCDNGWAGPTGYMSEEDRRPIVVKNAKAFIRQHKKNEEI